MSSEKAATEKFIDQMTAFFGEPYKSGDGAVVKLLIKNLAPFSEAVLMAVAEQFAMERQYRTWPQPVEIIKACRAKEITLDPKKAEAAKKAKEPPPDPWSMGRKLRADSLICCDLGVQAVEGGWIVELWDFCRQEGRLPEGREIDKVCQRAERHMHQRKRTIALLEDDSKWGSKSYGLRANLAELRNKLDERVAHLEGVVMDWNERRVA